MFTDYSDFELIIRVSGNGGALLIDLDGHPYGINLPAPIEVPLAALPPAWSQVLAEPAPDIAQLGHTLYNLVFEPIKDKWAAYLHRISEDIGVRVCISAQSTAISNAIWEMLCDPHTPVPGFLALNPRTPIVRTLRFGTVAAPSRIPLPLRVLIVFAAPLLQSIDPAAEQASLATALKAVVGQGQALVDYLGFDHLSAASFDQLQQHLALARPPYDIVHLISHGLLEQGQEGIVALVDPTNGKPQEVPASSLANLFRARRVRLVILQACESGSSDPSIRYFSSVAEQLVSAGVPAVLSMQESIDQDIARHFIQMLYSRWISTGCALEDALTQARQSIYQVFPQKVGAWAIPVLYIHPSVQVQLKTAAESVSHPPMEQAATTPQPASPVGPLVPAATNAVLSKASSSLASPPPVPLAEQQSAVVKERRVDAALPDKTRLGKETQLIVLIRLPDNPGLYKWLRKRRNEFDARPEDVRTSPRFELAFPQDPASGEWLPTALRIVIEASNFDPPHCEETVQVLPHGDDVQCIFLLTPQQEGSTGVLVKVLDNNSPSLTLSTIWLKTEVCVGPAFEATDQVTTAAIGAVSDAVEQVVAGEVAQQFIDPAVHERLAQLEASLMEQAAELAQFKQQATLLREKEEQLAQLEAMLEEQRGGLTEQERVLQEQRVRLEQQLREQSVQLQMATPRALGAAVQQAEELLAQQAYLRDLLRQQINLTQELLDRHNAKLNQVFHQEEAWLEARLEREARIQVGREQLLQREEELLWAWERQGVHEKEMHQRALQRVEERSRLLSDSAILITEACIVITTNWLQPIVSTPAELRSGILIIVALSVVIFVLGGPRGRAWGITLLTTVIIITALSLVLSPFLRFQ